MLFVFRPIMPTPSVVIETTDTTGATSIFRQSSNDIEDDRLKEDDDNDQRSSSSSSSSSSSCSGGSGGGGGGGDAARSKGGRHSIVGTKVLWPCKGMTDFHFSLMVGVIVFLIFWILLLLRIYMPELYLDEEDLKEKVDENLAS